MEATKRPWRHSHNTIYAEREVVNPMAQRSSTVATAVVNIALDEHEANAELIVRAVNSFDSLLAAARFARNRLLQDSGDAESINKLDTAIKAAEEGETTK